MNTLILGCNQLTRNLAPDLAQAGHDITVLGEDRESLAQMENGAQVEDGAQVRVIWMAEPMMRDYLRLGGIESAEVFLALSTDDHRNALAAQLASHIFNVPKVICQINDPRLQVLYSGLQLNVVGFSFGLMQDIRQQIES